MTPVHPGVIAARDAVSSALITLEMPRRRGAGFLATSGTHFVTNLHLVAGVENLWARLADGRRVRVERVVAFDEKRDLAVLQLPGDGPMPPRLEAGPLPERGAPVFAVHSTADGLARLWETRVREVQVLDDSFTFVELEGALPEEFSGSPMLDASGAWIGVATCAFADGRAVTIIIPARYTLPLLGREDSQPLSALGLTRPTASRERNIPEWPLSMLEGSAPDVLEEVAYTLLRSIQLGAPVYNQGNPETCYRLYAHTAERLLQEREDCPGVQWALRECMERCDRLPGADARAWALRDTFDGLLGVIGRWLRAQSALAYWSAPKAWVQ